MARQWTCRGCKTVNARVKPKCTCGRARPKPRKPAHRAVLDSMPYEEWVERFGDSCNICGAKQKEGGPRLHRDHAHSGPTAGLARGILCFRCNSALPSRCDSAWLEKAAAYLRRTEALVAEPATRYCRDCAVCAGGRGCGDTCPACGHECDGNAVWPVPMEGASA